MYVFYDAGSRMWQTDITYKGGIFDCKSWESVKVASFSSYCHFMENDNNLFDVQEVMAFSIVFYLCIIPSNRTVLGPKKHQM